MNPLANPKNKSVPWWRVGMVWLVLSGPLSVMVASFFTVRLALLHPDPVLKEPARSSEASSPALTPAVKARNHAATPPTATP
ncbi:MAG: hypothetical protein H7Z15_15730 [Rhizobacter sp.]|nr:hypothetical protein [Rhizobacter sp.]